MEHSVGMTLAVQSGCFVTSSPNMSTYLRELASDVGILQQKVSTGWISPYCDTCAGKISHAERFISIGEWLDRSSSEVTSKRNLNEKDTHSL